MRSYLLTTAALFAAGAAHAQTVGSGSINGLQYQTLTSPGGCSAATPCQIVTYLHYLGGEGNVSSDVDKYFNTPSFWAANPHTIVLAPMVNGSSSTNNWGGVQDGMSSNMQAAIALVKQTEATVPTQTNNVVVTGGSMGGIGTEAAMVEAGPKGTVTPGVFARGLAYDGALYNSDASAAANALCGVPFTMVHGTSDTTVPYSYDQSLASKLSGCKGFNFVPVQGATHGTWNNPAWNGYADGTLINQTIAATQQSSGSQPPPAADPAAPANPSPPPNITPGSGSVIDHAGKTWAISNDGNVTVGGRSVPGGGGTANVTMATDGTLWGLDDGKGPSPCSGCWFTLNADGQSWTPKRGQTPPSDGASADIPAQSKQTQDKNPPLVCGSQAAGGTFRTVGGRIIGPDGKDWIARGLNLYDFQIDQAATMTATFTGINFIRVNIHSYQDPSTYRSFVDQMTAADRVVEFESHPDGGGGLDAAPPGGMAAELAWYSAMAKAYAANARVWFGTFNEPMATDHLSAWQRATYDAIRGAGNNNPILLEISGYPGNWTNALNPSVYGSMSNTIWDPHFYGWVPRYSTDQTTVDHALADEVAGVQQIKSADGTMPVIVGEYGNSTDGSGVDANADQVVTAVVNAGSSGKFGSAAWGYDPGGPADHVTNGGQVTPGYGQTVQLYINTSVTPCSQSELTAQAQQSIKSAQATVLAQQQRPEQPSSPESTPQTDPSVVTANAQAAALIAQADALIRQAQAASAPTDAATAALIEQANSSLQAAHQ